ncbi:thioredoxin F-type, chloroplastic-like [Olea europaea subsp. europaea]|uniref:Thioredoxin F-type, chloroplastic-like n=1 Tax=Olea europaea subsp. europaea TaxID=158383 RepID=A0A8S0QNI3_OLEEU|nr:thioredoxin F-type, chloroplastic-like [Olea europaea subsp. europaea]
MSLQVQVFRAPPRNLVGSAAQYSASSWSTKHSLSGVTGDYSHVTIKREERGQCMGCFRVKANLDDAAGAVTAVGQVTEVTKDTFWPIVKAAGDKAVVLDMYTQWCGPCKAMAPKFQQLSEKYLDVIFLKLDCNHENRPLAKELGLKVVPTFKIFKDGKIVKEVTGAKFHDLDGAIVNARSS